MTGSHPEQREGPAIAARRFRVTLFKVMAVQVVTLALLGYLQYIFTP
jgi:hypothetical protein